jgi:hypothetical protein
LQTGPKNRVFGAINAGRKVIRKPVVLAMLQNRGRKALERIGGIFLLLTGWLLGAVGYGEPIGPLWSTVLFLAMPVFVFFGFYLVFRKRKGA